MARLSFLSRVSCAALLAFGLLSTAGAEIPLTAANMAALEASLPTDTRLERLPGDYALLIPEPFAPMSAAFDPVHQNRTTRTAFLYEKKAGAEGMVRRVIVHFAPDDRNAALYSARLIARLMRLHRERFGKETTFQRAANEAHVWFVPPPPNAAHVGGETRDANVYVFAASTIKTPIELVRTIAHEWGHETLPGARGYAEPENDAAGYLGERLYIQWLFDDHLTTYPDDNDILKGSLGVYRERQNLPLMKRWQEGGPASRVLVGDRTEAMDYYIGAVLDSDRAFGSRVVGDALYGITDTGPLDFLTALSGVLSTQLRKGLSIRLPAWIRLQAGTYQAADGGGRLLVPTAIPRNAAVNGGEVHFRSPRAAGSGKKPELTGRFRITTLGWNKTIADVSEKQGATGRQTTDVRIRLVGKNGSTAKK